MTTNDEAEIRDALDGGYDFNNYQMRMVLDELDKTRHYKTSFEEAIEYVDAVFQVSSENPNPILPDYCRLGASKFAAVVDLARDYLKLKSVVDRIAAALGECEPD